MSLAVLGAAMGKARIGLVAGVLAAAAGGLTLGATSAAALSPEGRDVLGTAVGVGAGVLLLDSLANGRSSVVVAPSYGYYGYPPPPPPPPVYVVPARPWGPPPGPPHGWGGARGWGPGPGGPHGGWGGGPRPGYGPRW